MGVESTGGVGYIVNCCITLLLSATVNGPLIRHFSRNNLTGILIHSKSRSSVAFLDIDFQIFHLLQPGLLPTKPAEQPPCKAKPLPDVLFATTGT